MKKIIIGFVILGVIICAGYIFTTLKNKNSSEIYVFIESGNILIKKNANSSYSPASEKKTLVTTGSYIKTELGLAHVLFPNNSVLSVGENSEVEINYTKQKTSIAQLMGDTYSRVEKLTSGDSYEVSTNGTLAAVRGTKFAVRYDPKIKKAKVAVTENTVNVSRTESTNVTPTEVSVGMLASVDETINLVNVKQLVTLSPSKNDVSMQPWIGRNALLDEYIKTDAKNFFEKLIKTEATGNDINSIRARLEKAKNISTNEEGNSNKTRKTSLKALLSSTDLQKCSYSYDVSGITSSAVIYLGKGKMRVDSNVKTGGRTMKHNMIIVDETSYIWGDELPQGIKMSVTGMLQPQSNTNQSQSIDMTNEIDYSCEPWSFDESLFKLPSGIKFMDMSQMMKQITPSAGAPTGTEGNTSQCAACISLPEPSRTQCKTALGCK